MPSCISTAQKCLFMTIRIYFLFLCILSTLEVKEFEVVLEHREFEASLGMKLYQGVGEERKFSALKSDELMAQLFKIM